MSARNSDIYIIGEDHTNVAGLTLLRQRVREAGPGHTVMVEWYASLNGAIAAYNDNRLSKKRLESVMTSFFNDAAKARVPQLMEMLEEFKASNTHIIAYDVRGIAAALADQKEPRQAFIDWHFDKLQQSAARGEPASQRAAHQFYTETVAKYWNYSPVTKVIENITRQSNAQGIVNEDIIAARVIDHFSKGQAKTHVLAGAIHVDGQVDNKINAYGILDDALRTMKHKVHLTIAVDRTSELARDVNCRTSEKIDSYVVVNPQTQQPEQAFNHPLALKQALEQARQQLAASQIRLPASHYGDCDERYPTATRDPEYGPALRKLQQIQNAANSR